VFPLLQETVPGRGFHSGGSFPMRESPRTGETDHLGRPPGWRRLHVVDSSVFPSIPAATISLTVMANAWRIGHES
jgi:choline dehydrogenase-like flavoprotein